MTQVSSLLIVTTGWDAEPWRARFARHFPDRQILVGTEVNDPNRVGHAICWKPPHGLLAGLPELSGIYSLGAGVDHLLCDPALPTNVPVMRVIDPDLSARMSEWVCLNVLMHHRQTLTYLDQQRARLWQDQREQAAACTVRVGIMGMGELGCDAAAKLSVLGYDIAGFSRSGRADTGTRMFGADDLATFLARTDILVVLLPLTDSTRGMLNRALFSALARNGRLAGPVLINAGRGGLQNEADILAALDDGTLHAASLDVFETEPLPEASPLWEHPRVVVTPHVAAESDPDAVSAMIARQIRQIEAGEMPDGLVDREAGY